MPYRKVEFMAGYYYHLYNRGVNRQPIFFCDDNWGYFIKRLRDYCLPDLIEVVAYCLMPNHYHLLVYLKSDKLGTEIMQPFSLAYTKAVNRQQERVGPLFQGPFRAILVDEENYLLHLSRYIHWNPVAAKLVRRPEDWIFSSYRDYIGLRKGTFAKPDVILSRFPTRQAYQTFVDTYHDADTKVIEHLLLD